MATPYPAAWPVATRAAFLRKPPDGLMAQWEISSLMHQWGDKVGKGPESSRRAVVGVNSKRCVDQLRTLEKTTPLAKCGRFQVPTRSDFAASDMIPIDITVYERRPANSHFATHSPDVGGGNWVGPDCWLSIRTLQRSINAGGAPSASHGRRTDDVARSPFGHGGRFEQTHSR